MAIARKCRGESAHLARNAPGDGHPGIAGFDATRGGFESLALSVDTGRSNGANARSYRERMIHE
jgi:hypothetical protein